MQDPSDQSCWLDELGWLQFERLCSLVLEREAGLTELDWRGRADEGRVALVDRPIELGGPRLRLPGPVAVAVVWVRDDASHRRRLSQLFAGVSSIPARLGFWFDQVLVLTNLDGSQARRALELMVSQVERF